MIPNPYESPRDVESDPVDHEDVLAKGWHIIISLITGLLVFSMTCGGCYIEAFITVLMGIILYVSGVYVISALMRPAARDDDVKNPHL